MINVRATGPALVVVALVASCTAPSTARREPSTPPPRPGPTGPAPPSAAWKRVPTPRVSDSSELRDAAVSGPRDVWAVGSRHVSENDSGRALVLRWDGKRWHRAPAPAIYEAHDRSFPTAVAAGRPDSVWVIGSDGFGRPAFVSHWNGRRWTDRSFFVKGQNNLLLDVAAADDKVWFAGGNSAGGMVAEWDGHAVRPLQSGIGGRFGALNAISAGNGQMWAVGYVGDEHNPNGPLIYRRSRDGSQQTYTPDVPHGGLEGVWQVSPSEVWAVGIIHLTTGDLPLVLRWDGSAWSRVQVPVARGELYGVTAFAANDVWISGVDAGHRRQALFLHYDGANWTREYSKPLSTGPAADDEFEGVNRIRIAGVPGTRGLWATGSAGSADDSEAPMRLFTFRR